MIELNIMSQYNLLEKVDPQNIPVHVAVIMDGNGRWAKKKGMGRTYGHKNAIQAVKNTIEAARDIKVKYLTLYAFSTENWNRPVIEVQTLLVLLLSTIAKELDELMRQGICFHTIGDISKFPLKIQEQLEFITRKTRNATNGNLIIALNYGARNEIISACKSICKNVIENKINIEEVNELTISNHLHTKNIPDVDLLIRTSGEQRISNFLLWQLAYAELYFTDVLWPDFSKEDFFQAIITYQSRERRFGKISEQLSN